MGSDSHLARIKEGAAAWNKWRQQEPSARPDLNGSSRITTVVVSDMGGYAGERVAQLKDTN